MLTGFLTTIELVDQVVFLQTDRLLVPDLQALNLQVQEKLEVELADSTEVQFLQTVLVQAVLLEAQLHLSIEAHLVDPVLEFVPVDLLLAEVVLVYELADLPLVETVLTLEEAVEDRVRDLQVDL